MRKTKYFALLLAGAAFAGVGTVAAAPFPENCDAILVLSNATWWAERPQESRDVQLRMQRLGGKWDPVVVGHTIRGQNATHYGFITESASEGGAERLKIRFFVRPDRWIGGEAEAAYALRLQTDKGDCAGSWTGVVQGVRAGGTVTGSIESVTCTPGFAPPTVGEHPRLLIRRSDIPALKARAATPEGQATMASLKADKGVVPQAFVYALTGDPACASNVLAELDGPCNTQRGWWHHTGGDQHSPAIRAVEYLIAYDLAYDMCSEAMHTGLRANVADKLELYYWGAQNSQFNPNDTSNWSLLYRSALGLMGLAILDAPPATNAAAAPATPKEFPRLTPPANIEVGDGVPVVKWQPENTNRPPGSSNIAPWLFAGPVKEASTDDAFAGRGGIASARPKAGTPVGDTEFRVLADSMIEIGGVNLKKILQGVSLRSCYLYCILDVPEPGYFRLDVTGMKGVRYRKVYISGHAMEPKDCVYMAAGRYPVLARIWIEPVGGWEPLAFWAKLVKCTESEAMAWYAVRTSAALADAECGANWREELTRRTGRNLEAWAYARMAAYRAEKYFMRGLGDFGWDQEGGYTRHALLLAMPFAHCFRNTFGRDIRGADRMGKSLALAAARSVFSSDGARSQTYSSGGGPMDLPLFARGFSLVPEPLRPGVLWTWNRADDLAKAGKYRDVNSIIAQYDSLSTVMRFISVAPTLAEQNPGTVLPHVVVDMQKGGYVFRNRWKDGDDCVVQLFANSNNPGGTWGSQEGGDLRIDGLGASWAVRGQGYGQGDWRNVLDSSAQQTIVDVAEQSLGGLAQGWVTYCAPEKDGSGVVSLNMDEVYLHYPKEATVTTNKGREVISIKETCVTNLGIHAVRSMAVDYSGASGVPCMIALTDRITGTKGSNVWTFVTEKEHTVTVSNNVFVITATNGATLRGTIVRPADANLGIASSEFGHEVNYHGSHNHTRFRRTMVKVYGKDRDQDFLVVMTIQRGEAPPVTIAGSGTSTSATVGKRRIGFDGEKIALDTPEGGPRPVTKPLTRNP